MQTAPPDHEPIAISSTAERRRGLKEAQAAINALNHKWPAAFPANPFQVRPLALGIVAPIAEAMTWTQPYTIAVMNIWKARAAYCKAILSHLNRYHLDGTTAEPIDDKARALARERLEKRRQIKVAKPIQTAQPPAPAPPAPDPVPPQVPPIHKAKPPEVAKPIKPAAPVAVVPSPAEERDKAFKAKMAQLIAKRRRS